MSCGKTVLRISSPSTVVIMPANLRICIFRYEENDCVMPHAINTIQNAISFTNYDFFERLIPSHSLTDALSKILLEGFDAFVNPSATCNCQPRVAIEITRLLQSQNQRVLLGSRYGELPLQRTIVGSTDLIEAWRNTACQLRHFSVLAVEVHGCNLLTRPIEYHRAGPDSSSFIHFQNHHGFSPVESAQVVLDIDPTFHTKLKRLVLAEFESFIEEPYGLARVDVTVEGDFKNYAVTVNFAPTVFPCSGCPAAGELTRNLPGSYDSLLALTLSSIGLRVDVNDARDRREVCRVNFNALAPEYDYLFGDVPQYEVIRQMVKDYRWDKRVLDIGCGSGLFGEIVKSRWPKSIVVGTDISDGMVQSRAITNHYLLPIFIGDMEQNLLKLGLFDHVVCFSVLQYVDSVSFLATLAQIFVIAEKSVTFDVMDISSEYLSLLSMGSNERHRLKPHSHLESMKKFATPPGWKKVMETRRLAFQEPEFQMDIETVFYRYESL